MILGIIAIVINILAVVVMNIEMYTDRAYLPGEETKREWHRSPIDRLQAGDNSILLYLQLFFAAVSTITSILVMVGINNKAVRIIQLISTICSVVMFIIIMIVAGNTHPHY